MGKATFKCSFCAKSNEEVYMIIAGPAVYICDECVDICALLIAGERAARDRRNSGEREYDSWEPSDG